MIPVLPPKFGTYSMPLTPSHNRWATDDVCFQQEASLHQSNANGKQRLTDLFLLNSESESKTPAKLHHSLPPQGKTLHFKGLTASTAYGAPAPWQSPGFPPAGAMPVYFPQAPVIQAQASWQPVFPAAKPASGVPAHPKADPQGEDASIWRDTALRYGGYADEVGEFMSPYLGGFGKFVGYGISSVYCLADLSTTLVKKITNHKDDPMSTPEKSLKISLDMTDLAIFHLFATLLIPPKIIGTAVEFLNQSLDSKDYHEAKSKFDTHAAKGAKGLGHQFEKGLLNGSAFIQSLIGEPLDMAVEKLSAKESLFSRKVAPAINSALNATRKPLASIYSGTHTLATVYDKAMPVPYFKIGELLQSLSENVAFLRGTEKVATDSLARKLLIKPFPVLLGIGMVPLIAHPFDKLMLKTQDWSNRLLFTKTKVQKDPNGGYHAQTNLKYWPEKTVPGSQNLNASPFNSYQYSAYQPATNAFHSTTR